MNQLKSDKDMELMQLELNRILEAELSKPAEEMDLALIDELMDMLEVQGPTETQLAEGWSEVQKHAHGRKSRRWTGILTRIAAGFAALIAVFFISFETAKAFRWTHLLKVLAPVAETFGIYSASGINFQAPSPADAAYYDEDTEYAQQSYHTLEAMPTEVDGFRVVPGWVPERFSFVQGAVYVDPDMAEASVSYRAGEDTMMIRWMLSYSDEDVFAYEYERTLDIPLTQVVNELTLNFYENMDSDKLSASWVMRDAHYQISGNLNAEELKMVAESLME